MANYLDAGTQTLWAGLTKSDFVRPEFLLTAPNTTTPPDDMITDKPQNLDMLPSVREPKRHKPTPSLATTLLERRKNRPPLVGRISLPNSDIDDEVLPSPPPTQALLSPLPAANKLHAGHTPLFPRSPSPEEDDEEQSTKAPPVEQERPLTPEEDVALEGPLILPTNPVDGADDHIALDVLDNELERLAKEQQRFSKLKDAPEPTKQQSPSKQNLQSPEQLQDDLALSRKGSADSRRSDREVVDGIILKTPPMNFGAPLGQV